MNEDPKNAEVSAEETADSMNYNYKHLGRELAMQFLFQCDLTGGECTDAMRDEFWAQAEESGEFPANRVFRKARNYAERLVTGVNENENELMDIISEFSHDWDADRIAPVDRSIMKIAIYEMKYSDGIPLLVSIDEAIEIAKKFGSEKSSNFINGILNSVKNNLIKKS